MTYWKGRLRPQYLRNVQYSAQKHVPTIPGSISTEDIQVGGITGTNVQQGSIQHNQLGGVTTDQHHPKEHLHPGILQHPLEVPLRLPEPYALPTPYSHDHSDPTSGSVLRPLAINAPWNADSLYTSIYNFQRNVTGANVVEAGGFFKIRRTSGGTSADAITGVVGLADLAAAATRIDHAVGVAGVVQPEDTTDGSRAKVWFGMAGHAHATARGTALLPVQYVGMGGTTSAERATSMSDTTLFGGSFLVNVEGSGVTTGATAVGLLARVTSTGWTAAANAVFGDGTASGQNFPSSFRGYSSLSGNAGEAKMDILIFDVGSTLGALAFLDVTDARLNFGLYMKLSDSSATSAVVVQNSGGTDVFLVRSNGDRYGIAGSTGMTAGFPYMPAAAGTPTGVPTTGAGRNSNVPYYYDTTNNRFYVYNGGWKSVVLA
ncbi:MAG TPA: hypothetical protein VFK94_06450 [Patescibacteria group bacterium]|nr:hypothetical protein [Patescibacteria group bacterium]